MKNIEEMKEEVRAAQMKVFDEEIVPYIEQLVMETIAKKNYGFLIPQTLLEKMLTLAFVQEDIKKIFENCGFAVDANVKYYYLSWETE